MYSTEIVTRKIVQKFFFLPTLECHINKTFFCFLSDFDETWQSCSYPSVLQFYQVSLKSDKKQKKVLLIATFSVQNFKVSVEL